jgi:uncharacterized protein (TIGR00251 family)
VIEPSTRIRIRVAPGAARSGVVGRHGDGWKVRVAAPPADGRANAALCRLLASLLAVDRHRLRIVAGVGSRDKMIEVAGRSADDADRRLSAAAQGVMG